jgi:hypothetical protein
MKAILITLLLIATDIQAQSAYNANQKLDSKFKTGKWFLLIDEVEAFEQDVTTVGVFKVYTELNRVLDFYKLDFNKPFINDSYLSSLVKDDKDFEAISLTAKINESIIQMSWKTENYLILYQVNSNNAFVSITTLKK